MQNCNYIDQNDFHVLFGETIMFCQMIEIDLKRIYLFMSSEDFEKEAKKVNKYGLGQIIRVLETLDAQCESTLFNKKIYEELKNIAKIRNYWVHHGYINFIYSGENKVAENGFKQYYNLIPIHNNLKNLKQFIEDTRINFCSNRKN